MGKNEIKIRRQKLGPEDIGRYRDYGSLMRQHQRYQRQRQLRKIFTWSMLITLIILLLLIILSYMVFRFEKPIPHARVVNPSVVWAHAGSPSK